MKIRLADYVADFLVRKGVTDVFTVTGGGAMHLNDALGHNPGLRCTYNHHEQGSAIAAEAYARLQNRVAAVCVTTGPGGTNALTGVVGGWLDSIPMFIISGQVKYTTTARYNEQFTEGLPLRAVGDQEYDIVKSVKPMTKYAVMIEDPLTIRYHLERAWHLMSTGRPGPVWLDIPVNYQGCTIETEDLPPYEGTADEKEDDGKLPPAVSDETVDAVLDKIAAAERPVFYAGNGIRLAGAYEDFRTAVDRLGIPVVTYWDAIDLVETDHPLYTGRGGNMGDRPGNFAVQNADLILAVGNRLPIRVVGYNWETWAREAYVIDVDVDKAELLKPTIHVEMGIHADAKDFLRKLNDRLDARGIERLTVYSADDYMKRMEMVSPAETEAERKKRPVFLKEETHPDTLFQNGKWVRICEAWKRDYPVVLDRMKEENDGFANCYAAFDYISRELPERSLTVTSNGTCCVAGHQCWYISKGSRFFNNNAIASMGYGLPASIGACRAFGDQKTICLEGDGSIMMNLQELQTVVTNRLPIKIFLINNQGYHSIRQTQSNLFANHTKVGIGPESHDLSFPDFSKIARAFGLAYFSAHSNEEMEDAVDSALQSQEPCICEIFVSTTQKFEPKSSTKRLEDGTLVSPPLEDLAPFLPREELEKNLYIKPLEGE